MKIGLLTSTSLSEYRINTLNPILKDNNYSIDVAIIDCRPRLSTKQKIKKNIKRGRGGYILVMALKSLFTNRKRNKSINTVDFCQNNGIDVFKTQEPYSAQTINSIVKYNLDLLILIGGFGIIKDPLLNITPIGVLSYHHGNMRKYRGMPPALWEIYNNENEMGVTVQILSSGLDSGTPIAEKIIPINKNDSLNKLREKAYDESVDMLYQALNNLSNKEFTPQKIDSFGKVYTLPNLRQWLILNIKLLWRKIKLIS